MMGQRSIPLPFTQQNKTNKEITNFQDVLLESSNNLIFVKDRRYHILYANQPFLELYPPDERDKVIGSPSEENFQEDDAAIFLSEDRKAFENGYSEIVEEIQDYTGNKRNFHTQKIRFTDSETGDLRILGIATDVTRLVDRERQLAESNLALENFARMAAHDLRSPLAELMTSIESITYDAETHLSPKSLQFIALMNNCIENLMDLITNILETCKINGLDEEMETLECDLSMLLEEVKFNLGSKIKTMHARILSTKLPTMNVNKALFRQLLHNLIENSLKYRSRSTPIIIIRHQKTDKEDLFSIEDNGIGIRPENREKIFDLYQQSDKKNEGYGIGLSLCKTAIEAHGGRIWVDENYNPGCKIFFSIPLK